MIAHDACFKETLQFLLSQQTRAQAHLKIRFLANDPHEFNCFAHFTRRELSTARHKRKPRETVCLCLFCSFERLVGIDERIDGNACDKTPRLGAPGAVFRTTARFGIDDAAEVKDPICELDRCLFGGCHERLRGIRAQFQSLFPSRHAFQRSDGKVQAGVFFGYRFHCLLLILEFSCVAVRN